jgi:hypothetical protein
MSKTTRTTSIQVSSANVRKTVSWGNIKKNPDGEDGKDNLPAVEQLNAGLRR